MARFIQHLPTCHMYKTGKGSDALNEGTNCDALAVRELQADSCKHFSEPCCN